MRWTALPSQMHQVIYVNSEAKQYTEINIVKYIYNNNSRRHIVNRKTPFVAFVGFHLDVCDNLQGGLWWTFKKNASDSRSTCNKLGTRQCKWCYNRLEILGLGDNKIIHKSLFTYWLFQFYRVYLDILFSYIQRNKFLPFIVTWHEQQTWELLALTGHYHILKDLCLQIIACKVIHCLLSISCHPRNRRLCFRGEISEIHLVSQILIIISF